MHQLHDIACTEDKHNFWRQIWDPQFQGRDLFRKQRNTLTSYKLQFKLKIHVVLEMCVNVAQKLSRLDLSTVQFHMQIGVTPEKDGRFWKYFISQSALVQIYVKSSISIRILLLSAMPSLSSSESTAIIVVAILSSCMDLRGLSICVVAVPV